MTNGGSSEMSVSSGGGRAPTPPKHLFIFFNAKINKTLKWDFLATIWQNNHQDTPGPRLSRKIKHLVHSDSGHGCQFTNTHTV